ncbi:molybdopterin molybdotransferase MoeA [Wenjunlia tyrosinilytica]|uniref:Molybdopterin molybdenumtransferase n=1 Tax=Wenjunlia tyrosinilytica TaxID=1544741 RepID=A0A917ZMD6_9ACTN|nr:molybdopterin molybdotransferase MoeA [Wenjunlia tyrosinilytica]GGO86018.1 molybdopterin molybdenumtransferase MoeA [Wenjunlia tyrosinilytica]
MTAPAEVPKVSPQPTHRPGAAPWPEARRTARTAARPLPRDSRLLAEALGHVLARPLSALTDLPAFDTSAMDGWAVAGPGPWRLGGAILAGDSSPRPLEDGAAVRIATGAQLPRGATAVLRSEEGEVLGGILTAARAPGLGQDVRPRGQECRTGDELLSTGCPVTPAVLGLAAAAGYDALTVVPRPTVEVLVLGDELLPAGLPRDGHVRDALGPLLPPWLRGLGADVLGTRRVGDTREALREAVSSSTADVVVTTGGTASGPVDFVHSVLSDLGARLLVDGVAVRPGHPMLLAVLPGGRHLVGLPGNPLAAVSGVLTLAEPLLSTLAGLPRADAYAAALTTAVPGHPADTRLVPVTLHDDGGASALRFHGPAMLRGLAAADAFAVIAPGGADAGADVEILELRW